MNINVTFTLKKKKKKMQQLPNLQRNNKNIIQESRISNKMTRRGREGRGRSVGGRGGIKSLE